MRPRHERMSEFARISALLPQATEQLMKYPGVRHVSVGLKETAGKPTEEIVFRVYVELKKPASELSPQSTVPESILGVKTDVLVLPTPSLSDDDDKYRPLIGGMQIGNDSSSGVGTMACIARLDSDGSIVMLSNHHVMMGGGASNGEKIGQPTISCCCCCKGNIVGEVVNSRSDGLVDCAIARITGTPGFMNEIIDIGLILGAATLNAGGSTVAPGDRVLKRGRTTGLTTGTVTDPKGPTNGNTEEHIPARTNQIHISPDAGFDHFQWFGDSGSALVNEQNVVVGLCWGINKNTNDAFANLITDVTSAMGISIINAGTAGTIPLGGAQVAEVYHGAAVERLDDVVAVLETTASGRDALAMFREHGDEINRLLNENRQVKVSWHRYQGPAFTGHFIKSAREPDHRIPAEIEGVSPANVVLRMSAVLQDEGSAALAAAVAANTVPLLHLVSGITTVEELLKRATARDDATHAELGEAAQPA